MAASTFPLPAALAGIRSAGARQTVESSTLAPRAAGRLSARMRAVLGFSMVLVVITVVETTFVYGSPAISAVLALALALTLAATAAIGPVRAVVGRGLEGLAIVPLYVLLTASLPWFFLDKQLWLPVIYALVLALCLWHLQASDLSVGRLIGLHLRPRQLLRAALIGLAIGIPSGTMEYLVLPQPAVPQLLPLPVLRDVVYMLFFVGLGEELLFRGVVQRELTEAVGWKWGLFLASALFMIMHLTWRSAPELGFTFLAGALFGYLYHRTGNLATCTFYHAVNNVMLVAIAPHFLGVVAR